MTIPDDLTSCIPNSQISPIDNPTPALLDFITNIYSDEPYPIFEQNWVHIFSYLKFQSRIFTLKTDAFSAIAVLRQNRPCLFTPKIFSLPDFIREITLLIKKLNLPEIDILNISENWLTSNQPLISRTLPGTRIRPRSVQEAVYDVEETVKLEGKHFSGLRSTRNRLLTSGMLTFKTLTPADIQTANELIIKWNSCQGNKYAKNKQEKEIFTINQLMELAQNHPEIRIHGGFFSDKLLSLSVFFASPTHPGWAINYILKGLNRSSEDGIHGISDATYLHVLDSLSKQGVRYLNDGELGSEQGTREHKLRFRPYLFLKSYDIIIPSA